MNDHYWQQFAGTQSVDCLALKAEAQRPINEALRHATPEAAVAYFQAKAAEFRQQTTVSYPDSVAQPLLIKEPGAPKA
jgi:hypothetical protein